MCVSVTTVTQYQSSIALDLSNGYCHQLQDWDANGTIDFAEFVYSFTSWVDVDEE